MNQENQDLHLKYRPGTFDEVVGQNYIVKSLKTLFRQNKVPHSFLFSGNSGVGKTTFARIIAKELGCDFKNIIEVDVGVFTGVETVRQLIENLNYGTIGKNPIKFIILDEYHAASKSFNQALLKVLEEPPSHVYFALCTTELNKIPKTIQTRCHCYHLKDVRQDDLLDLLEDVANEEKIDLCEESLRLIAKESLGSPRRALIYLSKCRGCEDIKDIAKVLETIENESEIIDLCRLLVSKNPSWSKAIKILKGLKEVSSESIRISIFNYCQSCVLGSKSEIDVMKFLNIMEVFSKPIYNISTGMGEILLGIGEICIKDELF